MIGMRHIRAGLHRAWGAAADMGTPIFIVMPGAQKSKAPGVDARHRLWQGQDQPAEIEGKDIPGDWALDKNGKPTTNATEALPGIMLPFGTYKGSAIAMMIAILCNELSGGLSNPDMPNLYYDMEHKQDVGHFFIVMDVSKFTDYDDFTGRVDAFWDRVKESKLRPDVDEIFMPGEIEYNNEEFFREKGIGCGDGVLRDLEALCDRFGLPHDAPRKAIKQ